MSITPSRRAGDRDGVVRLDLGQVALALSSAGSVDEVLDVLAQVGLPLTGGDGLLVCVVRGREVRVARHRGYGAQPAERFDRVSLDADTPIARTAAGTTASFFGDRESYLTSYPDLEPLVAASGKQAWAFLPMAASGRTIGTLVVSYAAPHVFPLPERAQLLALAGLCSQALERARLLDGAQQVSVALQQALLPAALPQCPGLGFAARYRPALQPEQVVGGDWYDAHTADDGSVVVNIGDVVGHDIHAAALMGELRHTLRAFASEGHGPSGVLHRVNRLLVAGPPVTSSGEYDGVPERLATCFYLQLDPLSGIGTAVCAGHPRPIVLSPGAPPRLLEVPTSLPLGVLAEAPLLESSAALEPGDTLVLYTDGLVEAYDVPVGDGIAALLERLAGMAAVDDLELLADAVLATCSESAHDDVALLLVRFEPVAALRQSVTRRFADEAVSVPLARAYTSDVLRSWGLADVLDTAVLVTAELVTNAVAHTVGYCELTLSLSGGMLRIEVVDRSSRLPQRADSSRVDADSEGGRGLLIVEALTDRFGVDDRGSAKAVWAEIGMPALHAQR